MKKQEERYAEKIHRDDIVHKWESGYRMEIEDRWVPIENLDSKITYQTLQKAREQMTNYILNLAHKILYIIDSFLTPEKRYYWWRLTHKLVSTKKSGNKCKRNIR